MAATRSKGLGKGLNALMGQETAPAIDSKAILDLDIHTLNPNLEQPRKHFDEKALEELASSIREHGVIQPLIVTRSGGSYQIVAGERRWRAAHLAGLKTVPVIVRELSDSEVLQQALIENIQRQDLNPIETAEALERLMQEHDMTQEALSTTVGMSRPALANSLRLLRLSDRLKDLVRRGDLSQGHARALLALPSDEAMEDCAEHIMARDLSVRDVEKLVRKLLREPKVTKVAPPVDEARELAIVQVEERLARALGTKVQLQDKRNRGRIVIEYYSLEDLDRIIETVEQTPGRQ